MSGLGKSLEGAITREQFIQGDSFIQKSTQDVESIVENNKALMNHDDGYTPSREMRRVASIPLVIVEGLMQQGIWGNRERFKKWLNDPDNRHFRTASGKI